MLRLAGSVDGSEALPQRQLHQLSCPLFLPGSPVKHGRNALHQHTITRRYGSAIQRRRAIILYLMSGLQEQLILSQLPYPKYFDGHNWNTIIGKTRKHIPLYLHDDLPKLKFQPLREEFKKLNQIECPRLSYFNQRIRSRNHPHHSHHKGNQWHQQSSIPRVEHSQRLQEQLKAIRAQLQYALLTSDRNSNVIKKLVDRAVVIEEELGLLARKGGKRPPKKRSLSMATVRRHENCFQNTLEIVLNSRKELLECFRQEQEEEEVKIKTKLLPFLE